MFGEEATLTYAAVETTLRRSRSHSATWNFQRRPAAKAGMIDLDRVMMEVLTSIRRAGADMILTYHALAAAEILGA